MATALFFFSELLWILESCDSIQILGLFFALSKKNTIGILIGIVFSLYVVLGSVSSLTILILLIHENRVIIYLTYMQSTS